MKISMIEQLPRKSEELYSDEVALVLASALHRSG